MLSMPPFCGPSFAPLPNLQPAASMGGTYVANAVSCASAIATLRVMKEEGLLLNAQRRGKQLMDGLVKMSWGGAGGEKGNDRELGRRFPFKDLRGQGLMVGLEFEAPQGSGVATAVTKACLRRGMILLTCSTYETVRFIPPLNVSETEMQEGLQIFKEAVAEVCGEYNSS